MRALALGRTYALAAFVLLGLAAGVGRGSASRAAETGGAGVPPPPPPGPDGRHRRRRRPPLTTPLPTAQLSRDGRTAIPPAAAPQAVKNAIYAANRITASRTATAAATAASTTRGYDCSGTVSYALRGGGLVKRPLHSTRVHELGRGRPRASGSPSTRTRATPTS